jgi:DNA-binding transcriptional ArsR family regulator
MTELFRCVAIASEHEVNMESSDLKDVLSAGKCAELLKALAEPERLRIVQALRERPQCVSDLAALLDNEIGNISHHLKILRKQGFVTNARAGKTIIYSLSKQVLATRGAQSDRLELGCCRLEIPK